MCYQIWAALAFVLSISVTAIPQSSGTTSCTGADYSCVDGSSYCFAQQAFQCVTGTSCSSTVNGAYNPCVVSSSGSAGVAPAASSGSSTPGGGASSSSSSTLSASSSSGTSVSVTSSSSAASSIASSGARKVTMTNGKRYTAYWSIYAELGSVPTSDQLQGVTQVVLSFVDNTTLTSWLTSTNGAFDQNTAGQLQTNSAIGKDLQVMAAFGGWALDDFFRTALQGGTSTTSSLAQKIVNFVKTNHLSGAALDYEYPNGNGYNYKASTIGQTNAQGGDQFVQLMKDIRAIDSDMLLSVAVPSRTEDIPMGFTSDTIPQMAKYVDWFDVMTYDFVNRRDDKTGYHAGGSVIGDVVGIYQGLSMQTSMMNIGFPMYAKWFIMTDSQVTACKSAFSPIGCDFGPFEDSTTGADLGTSGTYTFDLPLDVSTNSNAELAATSWSTVPQTGVDNSSDHASAWLDDTNKMFWTWVSADDIGGACSKHLPGVGGAMVWSLNQDTNGASGGDHLAALSKCVTT